MTHADEFKEILNGTAHVIIGKNGVTENIQEHISALLKKNKFIKIKVKKDLVQDDGLDYYISKIIVALQIYVLDARGGTFIISKRFIKDFKAPKKYQILRKELIPEVKKEKIKKQHPKKKETTSGTFEYIDYNDEELLDKLDEDYFGQPEDSSVDFKGRVHKK